MISLRAVLALGLALAACGNERLPDGTPCTSAASCQSGLCLTLDDSRRVCAQRCAADPACAAPLVCGRFDFRGRDDAGLPAGEDQDIVRVCRARLDRPCAAGCAPGEGCFGGPDGVCARRCEARFECGGRDCVETGCGERLCAPPCDTILECPRHHLCDQLRSDAEGHGQCISNATGVDAGARDACVGDT